VLLQVLDDGRLTDGQGRTVDFRNTVIVMTSNLGSQQIQELVGEAQGSASVAHPEGHKGGRTPEATEENYQRMKDAVMEVVGAHFRPEFINRIDESVVFHPLGREQIRAITTIQIDYLRKRLAERELGLKLSDAVLDKLGEAGFDPVYGARPLKRAIQQQLENPLAQKILAGHFHPGQVVEISLKGGRLQFTAGSEQASAA